MTMVEEFEQEKYGWPGIEIINLLVNINRYALFQLGLSTYINLPKYIQNKKAVVDIINNDPYCFLWADTSVLNPVQSNPDHESSSPHSSEILKYDDIKFPISLTDVTKFEEMNNLRINIYGGDREEIFFWKRKPSRLSKYNYITKLLTRFCYKDIY